MRESKPKQALVTGGAKRVGRAIALHLASNGYDIALHYHSSYAEAEVVKAQITALGRNCEVFQHNLRERDSIPGFMDQVRQVFPCCGVLVNSASVIEKADFLSSTDAMMEEQFSLNLFAPVALTKAFALTFEAGVVINILDTDIVRYRHTYFMYQLSKKAFRDFTMLSAKALAPAIRVNAVCPGTVLPDKHFGEDKMEALRERLPMQKLATPEDVAAAVLMLVESDYLAGQLVFVDGGQALL